MTDQQSAMRNGLEDGWQRPPGPAPQPMSGRKNLYDALGISLRARYWVFWVTSEHLLHRPELRCCFDSLEEAQAHAAERVFAGDMCGGVWDRRLNAWAL